MKAKVIGCCMLVLSFGWGTLVWAGWSTSFTNYASTIIPTRNDSGFIKDALIMEGVYSPLPETRTVSDSGYHATVGAQFLSFSNDPNDPNQIKFLGRPYTLDALTILHLQALESLYSNAYTEAVSKGGGLINKDSPPKLVPPTPKELSGLLTLQAAVVLAASKAIAGVSTTVVDIKQFNELYSQTLGDQLLRRLSDSNIDIDDSMRQMLNNLKNGSLQLDPNNPNTQKFEQTFHDFIAGSPSIREGLLKELQSTAFLAQTTAIFPPFDQEGNAERLAIQQKSNAERLAKQRSQAYSKDLGYQLQEASSSPLKTSGSYAMLEKSMNSIGAALRNGSLVLDLNNSNTLKFVNAAKAFIAIRTREQTRTNRSGSVVGRLINSLTALFTSSADKQTQALIESDMPDAIKQYMKVMEASNLHKRNVDTDDLNKFQAVALDLAMAVLNDNQKSNTNFGHLTNEIWAEMLLNAENQHFGREDLKMAELQVERLGLPNAANLINAPKPLAAPVAGVTTPSTHRALPQTRASNPHTTVTLSTEGILNPQTNYLTPSPAADSGIGNTEGFNDPAYHGDNDEFHSEERP